MATVNGNNISNAQNLINGMGQKTVKVVKSDRGLIERKDLEDKVILVEDNRQVLFG